MTTPTDGRQDFDFLFGKQWRVHNRRLTRRLDSCTEWQELDADMQAHPVLGGTGNVDSFSCPAFTDGKPFEGMTVRVFDPGARLWSIWWVDDRTPQIQPPVVGRFESGRGEFFGDDTFKGRPIRVRFIWSDIAPTSAKWNQAFSEDGGKTWETNWYMELRVVG